MRAHGHQARHISSLAKVAIAASAFVLALASGAHAADVEAQMALVRKRPAGMADAQWRTQRRDAARELGLSGDKRAVPVLVEVLETERNDEIVSIAMESLGRLGDRRAVESLAAIHRDEARDRFTRDTAARSLRALGVDPETGAAIAAAPMKETDAARINLPGAAPAPAAAAPTAAAAPDWAQPEGTDPDRAAAPAPVPTFAGDALGATQRFTFALGSLSATRDGAAKRSQVSADLAARYERGLERPAFGWSAQAGAQMAGGAYDRDTDNPDTGSKAILGGVDASAEGRFYASNPRGLFGGVQAAAGASASAYSFVTPMAETKDFAPSTTFSAGLGPGVGRVLDVGARMRVRRIETALAAAKALTRPIDAETSRRLQLAWWSLRAQRGTRRHLLETVRILREAGFITAEPDPATAYRIIRVLDDGQLNRRLDGADLRLGIGETFIMVDETPGADNLEWNRVETVTLAGRADLQLNDGLNEIESNLRGVYRLTGTPGFYTLDVTATFRHYLYTYGWDPRGALELTAGAGISDLNTDEPAGQPKLGPATRVFGRAGYLLMPNNASRLTIAAEAALLNHDLFLGLRAQVAWGLADVSFAAAPTP